jgi:hypothetical protein
MKGKPSTRGVAREVEPSLGPWLARPSVVRGQ